tara:strand:+ start:56 stop:520 length:465 start_codon:yes stop_codon:yes gene_type:complete
MIITCEKCSKKFNIEDNLIPENGRELQCGSCNHVWFFKRPVNKIRLDNEISERLISDPIVEERNIKIEKSEKKIIKEYETDYKEVEKNKFSKVKKNPKIIKNALIFIISIIALIVLLDTFKIQLKNFIPGLDSILNNLYESLKDISLFFKDLIN